MVRGLVNCVQVLFYTGSDEYVGCFIDTLTRLLPHEYVLNDESFHSDMENNMCLLHCKELGYIYFGTEAAGFCFCGDDPYWYGPENVTDNYIEDNDCNLKCIGDPEQICGGYWRLSVYRSGYIHFKKGQAQYQLVSNNTMLTAPPNQVMTARSTIRCAKYCKISDDCKVFVMSTKIGQCSLYYSYTVMCEEVQHAQGFQVYMMK
ncbi:Hypothetical predicted protein [Mytilus galloprovincialis]|uniref:WSC domain-containing protein n=1 Tax=Mytilus galloprovincialis TaxID=29158 RepID=A0A8B6BWZ9_MYTGA|nr:Hypothetical predicted protein [Mytilus galloprovincialis]